MSEEVILKHAISSTIEDIKKKWHSLTEEELVNVLDIMNVLEKYVLDIYEDRNKS